MSQNKQTTQKFKIGDMVRFKLGNDVMMIDGFQADGRAVCKRAEHQWHEAQKVWRETYLINVFHVNALVKISEKK